MITNYRVLKNYRIEYSGISGNFQVKNTPINLNLINGLNDINFDLECTDGFATIENIINNDKGISCLDLTSYASYVYKDFGIQCFSITQKFDKISYNNIFNNVKHLLIKVFIELEKNYGVLDSLDIDLSNKSQKEISKTNNYINKNIINFYTINIGDKNKITSSNLANMIDEKK